MSTASDETPEEFEMRSDADHPDGDHVYVEADSEENIDTDSSSTEPPYDQGDDGADDA